MGQGKREKTIKAGIIFLLIATACSIRIYSVLQTRERELYRILAFVRTGIYLGLFIAWGISIRYRIIQLHVRRYMTEISFLIIFWVIARTLKYFFLKDLIYQRYLWYSYYLAMLFVPCLAVLVAMSLGRPESYSLPRWRWGMLAVSGILFLLVFTNDFHQLVFVFHDRAEVVETYAYKINYHYNIVYWICAFWQILCGLSGMLIMIARNRVRKKRKWFFLPFLPISILFLYLILYFTNAYLVRVLFGDFTILECMIYIATLECCIQTGLIQSNIHYRELFQTGDVGAVIVDDSFREKICSDSYQGIPVDVMKQAVETSVILEDGTRLSGQKISGGYVLWKEDVSEQLAILEELQDSEENLEDSNQLLKEEYRLKAREAKLREKERIYCMIQKNMGKQLDQMEQLIDQIAKTGEAEEQIRMLEKMIVIGAYLKRRSNLILIADKAERMEAGELRMAFMESMDNLELAGISCGLSMKLDKNLPSEQAIYMYDFFEKVTECCLNSMSAMNVVISEQEQGKRMILYTDAIVDLSKLASRQVTVLQDEDREWQIILNLERHEGYTREVQELEAAATS